MAQELLIRDAVEGDLPEVLAIYNDVIATTTAVYSEAPATLDDRRDWWRSRVAASYPVLVAVDRTGIVGFSSFGEFRAWPCYRSTVEQSVHIRADRRGEGIGARLLIPLFPRAAALQKHMMIAAIDAQNEPSLRLHRRLGFEQAGYFREVGFKFGRWLDLVFMQRPIDPS
jgi:L-amino acid N-acyltransferase YncA